MPLPLRKAPGPGGASWAAMMRPSCCTDGRPSSPCSTTTTAAALLPGQQLQDVPPKLHRTEIARVEVPDWLAEDPELSALSHAMLVKQCQLGFGYPVAVPEAHEQAVISGHDRAEFRRLPIMPLEQRGLPTLESAKATSKRRPWV